MAGCNGCKRCALKGEKRERRKGEEKGGKNGDQNRFFCAHVFSYAQWSFFKYIRKTVSRLSRSYQLLFAIKILMVSQFGDLQEPNMHPTPILATFSNTSGRPKDMSHVGRKPAF